MLTELQMTVLEAVINVIIPPDEHPGGWDTGVGAYLLRQFERDLKDYVGVYQQGLLAIDAEAQAVAGKPFTALTADAQEALLTSIESGQVQTLWPFDPASFFEMLVRHCAEGFYSDPGNGGNRERTAWNMIGFEVTG